MHIHDIRNVSTAAIQITDVLNLYTLTRITNIQNHLNAKHMEENCSYNFMDEIRYMNKWAEKRTEIQKLETNA
jgi:hypothetical protein